MLQMSVLNTLHLERIVILTKKSFSLISLFLFIFSYTVSASFAVLPEFESAEGFNGLLAPVKIEGLYGFIDRSGNLIAKPEYTAADKLNNGYFKVRKNSKWGAVNSKGEVVADFIYDECSAVIANELWVVMKDGKWGAVDMQGVTRVAFIYDYLGDFTGPLAPVSNGGYWTDNTAAKYKAYFGNNYGYITPDGEISIKMQYDFAAPFKEGRARVFTGDAWHYIDSAGLTRGGPYDEGEDFSEGLAAVSKNGRWGYIDQNGTEVIDITYLNAESFADGASVVGDIVNDAYQEGVIDKSGNLIVPLIYDSISAFSEGAAIVQKGELYGFINTKGEEITPVSFSQKPLDFNEGVALVKSDAGDRFINKKGETILETGASKGMSSVFGGMALVKTGSGKFGYVKVMPGAGVRVMLNGETLKFDQDAVIMNDRTMVPLRVISENMGAEVSWDGDTKRVYIKSRGSEIIAEIDNKILQKDGQEIELEAPPVILNDRTMVPVRAIGEGIGALIEWDGDCNTVIITK